jgi:hypothetical protein
MRPGQSVEKLRYLADLERSARAEVKLRLKGIAYTRSQVAKTAERHEGMAQSPETAMSIIDLANWLGSLGRLEVTSPPPTQILRPA